MKKKMAIVGAAIVVIMLGWLMKAWLVPADRPDVLASRKPSPESPKESSVPFDAQAVAGDFQVFREGDPKDRKEAAEYVECLLNEKYVGKCSRKDVLAWLGQDSLGTTTERRGLSYLIIDKKRGQWRKAVI